MQLIYWGLLNSLNSNTIRCTSSQTKPARADKSRFRGATRSCHIWCPRTALSCRKLVLKLALCIFAYPLGTTENLAQRRPCGKERDFRLSDIRALWFLTHLVEYVLRVFELSRDSGR
jgi:hypothetical protein